MISKTHIDFPISYIPEPQNNQFQQKSKEKKNAYFGHFRMPSSESLDSGGFFSIFIPIFSVAIVSALIFTEKLRFLWYFEEKWRVVEGEEEEKAESFGL